MNAIEISPKMTSQDLHVQVSVLEERAVMAGVREVEVDGGDDPLRYVPQILEDPAKNPFFEKTLIQATTTSGSK